jgi:hypothetical protein
VFYQSSSSDWRTPRSPLAYDRLVDDQVESKPQAVLYRCRVPGNYLCPCGAVARRLRKSGVPFEQRRVAWSKGSRPEVEAVSGQTRVPVLLLEGEVISDSKRIFEHLAWISSQPDRVGV